MSLHRFTDGLDHRADAWANALSQYVGSGEETNWQRWWGTWFDALTEAEGSAWDSADVFSVLDGFPSADWSFTYSSSTQTYTYRGATYATWDELKAAILADAARLDVVGAFVGLTRTAEETIDEATDSLYKMCARNARFYARIVATLSTSDAGTPEGVLRAANAVTGDPSPSYCEEWPAKFLVWTPNPTTRTRMTADDLADAAPCGVRGINGVAISVGGGTGVLGTMLGSALLTRDQGDGQSAEGVDIDPLQTEDYEALETEAGDTIYLEEVE